MINIVQMLRSVLPLRMTGALPNTDRVIVGETRTTVYNGIVQLEKDLSFRG